MANEVVFGSVYGDPSLTNLKNLVFLFDRIIIPYDSILVIFDEETPNPDGRYIQLVPSAFFDDISFLEREGAVKLQRLGGSATNDLPTLVTAIDKGASRKGVINAGGSDINELFSAFELDSENMEHSSHCKLIAAALAAHTLGPSLARGACALSDNSIIYELGQCGLGEIAYTSQLLPTRGMPQAKRLLVDDICVRLGNL